MNGFHVISTVTDALSFDEILRMDLQKTGGGSAEQKNIDAKQITNGGGTVEAMQYMVPAQMADKLNRIPNPDRNGLVLLWAYQLHRIFEGREEALGDFLQWLYARGEVQYGTAVKKGRKRQDDQVEFTITADSLGMSSTKPESMSNIGDSEYERLRRFVVQCMLPSMAAFQQRWAATLQNKTMNFQNLALNLRKGIREVALVSQSD